VDHERERSLDTPGRAVGLGVPVALALDGDDMGVVEQPIPGGAPLQPQVPMGLQRNTVK